MNQNCVGWLKLTEQDIVLYKENLSLLSLKDKAGEALSRGGRLIIVCDNKLCVRDFDGYVPEGEDEFFAHINKQEAIGNRREYSKRELENFLHKAGISSYKFYYPYPFADFTYEIYSDNRLPMTGELHMDEYPFPSQRLELFREQNLYDRLMEEGLYTAFCNSYMVVIGEILPEIDYVKYSTERAEGYNVYTEIVQDKLVRKIAADQASKAQIAHINQVYQELSRRMEGSTLELNKCSMKNDSQLELEFLKGDTLAKLMDQALVIGSDSKESDQAFRKLWNSYRETIKQIYPKEEAEYLDLDLIFQNILVDGDRWQVIDYEWTFPEKTPVEFLFYRALHFYYYQSAVCRKIYPDYKEFMTGFGIEAYKLENYNLMEEAFQKRVSSSQAASQQIDLTGKHTLGEMLKYEEYYQLAQERMEVINTLQARCDERMQMIEDLKKLSEERMEVIDQLEADMQIVRKSLIYKIILRLKRKK